MNKNRIEKALNLALKIPHAANPLINPAYNYVTPQQEPLKAGDCWWMENGEVKKGKAETVEYRHMIKTRKQHVLSVHVCMCELCIKRLKEIEQLQKKRSNRKDKIEQLNLKLKQHNPASIIKVTV